MNADDLNLPDEIDRSGVSNTPAAIANWLLVTVVPTLNEVIEDQKEIIAHLRTDGPRDGSPDPPPSTGDGATAEPETMTAGNVDDDQLFEEMNVGGNGEADTGKPQATDDMQKLAHLLQDLDERAAQNLGEQGYSDPEVLRTTPNDELKDVSYVADTAIEKIRAVFPYDG